ncbi:MAG: hypothetical protein EHM46_00565 [Bacteroidetes bacterium]|nr:MAG: hypothetical protein EHM46_00565 [Bacteroidota bacterium]
MKMRITGAVILSGMALIFTVGCSSLPQEQIDAANTAIEEAKAAGAELYIPDDYFALQDSMKSVMENIEAEKSKFIKDFGSAEKQLEAIALQAGEVTTRTETRKEELRQEIQSTIDQVTALIEANRQLVLEAPKGKEGTSVLMAIGNELNTIEQSVQEAQTMLEQGEFLTTLNKAVGARDQAQELNRELEEVISKYKANVKARKT